MRNSRAKGGSSPSKRRRVFDEQHACACVRAPPKRIGRLSYSERATTKLRPRSSRTAAASPPSDRITRWSDATPIVRGNARKGPHERFSLEEFGSSRRGPGASRDGYEETLALPRHARVGRVRERA